MQKTVRSVVCRKCEKKLRPPFRVCGAEHLVCPHCRQHQDAAGDGEPCGGKEFSLPMLNQMFLNVLDFCQYKCGVRGNLLELGDHEQRCLESKKSLNCCIAGCSWRGYLSNVIRHVDAEHPQQLVALPHVTKAFGVGLDAPVLLLTQFDKASVVNEVFWLRVSEHLGDRYVLLVHQGHTGPEVDVSRKLQRYYVASALHRNHSIKADIVAAEQQDGGVLDDSFTATHGTKITTLEGDAFLVKIPHASSEMMSAAMLELLECDVCLEVMHAPIRLCVTGHSVCGACAQKVETCPKCRKDITKTRNYTLEQLSNQLDARCPHEGAGCVATGPKNKMDVHKQLCMYQTTQCVIYCCKWTGTYNDVLRHWKKNHADRMKPNGAEYTSDWYRYLYSVSGNNFVFRGVCDEEFYYYSVHHLTRERESDFRFDLALTHPSTGHALAISVPCLASEAASLKKKHNLLTGASVCKVPMKWFNDVICDGNRHFRMRVEIYRKTEAKTSS